jgi:hypothetical protein
MMGHPSLSQKIVDMDAGVLPPWFGYCPFCWREGNVLRLEGGRERIPGMSLGKVCRVKNGNVCDFDFR